MGVFYVMKGRSAQGRDWLIERAAGELPPVTPNSCGAPNLVSVADPLTPKPLLHSQLEMEPMAGIERFMLYFQFQKYDISPINASTFALLLTFPNEPITYPLTEGFTETFTEGFSAHARI
jgi:hypothetical protein